MGKVKQKHTKVATPATSVRFKKTDMELMRAAAAQSEISQSQFLRFAVREKAQRVLRASNRVNSAEGER